jgi:capsular exopolysaccharide synthesis family protein
MESKQYVEDIDFKKYWLILRRRWLPATSVFVLIVLLAATVAHLQKPTYMAQGRLRFKKKNTTSGLVTEAGGKIGELESLYMMNNPVDTEAEAVRATPLLLKTIKALNLKDRTGDPLKPEDLVKIVTVKPIKGTDVLEVSSTSRSPEEAAKLVNTVIELYIQSNIQSNRAEAVAAREFITQQLPKSEATVRQAEAALRSFKEKNNVVVLEEEAISTVRAAGNLDAQISTVQATLDDVTAQSVALQSQIQSQIGQNRQQAIALNSLSQSPGVQEALKELQKVEDQLAVERSRFQEQHPTIVNLRSKEASLKALLQERVGQVLGSQQQVIGENLQIGELQQNLIAELVKTEVQRLGLANQVASLSRAKSGYKQRADMLPRLQQGQRDLERQLEGAQVTYQTLLKNLQEVSIAENQNVGNASVMAYAMVPERPMASKKKLLLVGGVVAGSLLYVVTAFLLDLRDPSIKTAKEVRQLFRYTWLGMIPDWKKKGIFPGRKLEEIVPQLPVRDAPHSVSSEAYRMLQANLEFLNPDKELKVIVVTSSVSKEGKSTVCANLATAMAKLGRRVLLIDADMRHPMQHHIWDLANAVGLSDVIVNQAEFKMAVREVMDNLDVLPSGVIPPDSLALLKSKRMVALIEEFSKSYNFVIFDTPPLVLVADAITLGKMTDGILLVSRPGAIDRVSAAASKGFLVQSNQAVLGLVVNGVNVENEPDSYFHHAKTYYKEELTTSKVAKSKTGKKSSKGF